MLTVINNVGYQINNGKVGRTLKPGNNLYHKFKQNYIFYIVYV
jgi:hypothetical protein